MGDLIGYARVSTADQSDALQTDALSQAGCTRVFSDTASGALDQRPELLKCLDHLRKDDVLVVWRLDRLGRGLKSLLTLVEDLEARGIGFRSLTESLDTTSASGRMVMAVFGALAEYERALLRERTMAGLQAARARGRKGGRPRVMSAEKIQVARSMYDSKDHTVDAIAKTVGVSRKTIYRYLKADAELTADTPASIS